MNFSIHDPISQAVLDQLPLNPDLSPVTSGDSSPRDASHIDDSRTQTTTSSAQQTPRPILKGSSSGHTVTSAASETTPLRTRKNVSLSPTAQAVNQEGEISTHTVKCTPARIRIQPTITPDPTPSSDEDNLKPNQFTLRTSAEIKDGAKTIVAARQENLKTATRMCDKFLRENPNLNEESIAQLKEKFSVIQDQVTKAKKYSDWTTVRHSLLQGNKERAKAVEEEGYSIGSDWSQEQLEEDWNNAQQEPWATHDALFDLQKTINFIIAKKPSGKHPLPQRAEPEQKQPEFHQASYASSADEQSEDLVSVPGVGWVNRNKRDIGNVEYNDDGTYTITDMTGRRFDYPRNKPPSDSSCTIS